LFYKDILGLFFIAVNSEEGRLLSECESTQNEFDIVTLLRKLI